MPYFVRIRFLSQAQSQNPTNVHALCNYMILDTKEGETTLYRLARQRHQAGNDVQQVRMMKNKDGNVMPDEESVLRIWNEYYKRLMNEENERERRENDGERVNLEVESISKK